MKFKIEGTGTKHTKRITRDGEIVAMAERLTNDRWSLHSPVDDRKMTLETFETANQARNWVKANLA